MQTADLIVMLAQWWLYAGAAVAVLFLLVGIDRIDENARESYTFRPLLIPGILLLWPLVVWRWFVLETGRTDWRQHYRALRRAHAPIWLGLAVLIPLIFAIGLTIRQPWPAASSSIQLSAPGN